MANRTLQELTDVADPMWPFILHWITTSQYDVDVLPVLEHRAEASLLALDVTVRSPLGAMAHETGGILVDHGWLRLLGAGGTRMQDGLTAWNGIGHNAIRNHPSGAFIIAHDAVGGVFATNLGAFGPGPASVFYFSPDSLKWMDLRRSYAVFLEWAITGDIRQFYSRLRWPSCEQEVLSIDGDHGISFWPMLWTSQPPLEQRSRRVVAMRELWSLNLDVARQIAEAPPGTEVRITFNE